LMELHEIAPGDLERVREFGRIVVPRMDTYVTGFYAWLSTQPIFEQLFSDAQRLSRVQHEQVDYWKEFFAAQVDERYLASREHLGEVHARAGLPLPVYFTAMNYSLKLFTQDLYDGSLPADAYAAASWSITKLTHLDTMLVVEAFS